MLVNTLGVFVELEHLLSFVYQITTPVAIHLVYTSDVWSCHAARACNPVDFVACMQGPSKYCMGKLIHPRYQAVTDLFNAVIETDLFH